MGNFRLSNQGLLHQTTYRLSRRGFYLQPHRPCASKRSFQTHGIGRRNHHARRQNSTVIIPGKASAIHFWEVPPIKQMKSLGRARALIPAMVFVLNVTQ